MILESLLCILFGLFIWGLFEFNKKRGYFKERNIKHVPPKFIFGNSFDMLLGQVHQSEVMDTLYKAYPEEEILGFYNFMQPQYVIRSAEVVESVLVKDFSHFHDRISNKDEIESAAQANLFILQGNTWRAIRNKFSPMFTSGKLKYMYHTIVDCGKNLEAAMDKKVGEEVEMTDMMGLFAMDVIGSTAFGIEPNLLQNPDSKFREMGLKVFGGSLITTIKTTLAFLFPKFGKIIGVTGFTDEKVVNYFCNVISSTMERRKKDGTERNDFVQMLLQLKEKGKIEVQVHDTGDDYLMLDKINDTFELELTDNILVGGAFSFLLAGFHATAMTLAYTFFQLSQHPEIRDKLRAEIKEQVKGETPTYEELKNMPYLDKVIKEVARFHPTAPVSGRVCTKEYTSPSGVTIRQGENILIPVQALHMDPAHWHEPEIFNPDRFDTTPVPGTYLPFGDGPRVCIAMRFAVMELKFAVTLLLMKYKFELSKKTKLPLRIHPRIFLATPLGGITFHVTKI